MEPSSVVTVEARSDRESRELNERVREFELYRTPAFAADLVGAAFAHGRPEVARHAAELVLTSATVSPLAHSLARQVLGDHSVLNEVDGHAEGAQEEIRVRRLLRLYPRSPLLWTDLALLRISTADAKGAGRWLNVALQLAPNNRFVLRSATRYWLHLGEPDRAHALLARAPAISSDPWLSAAMIAVADVAGRPPLSIRAARLMVDSQRFPALHTAELAAAIGTQEWMSGRAVHARRWFRRALVEPTENALAQVAWIARRETSLRADAANAHAARAWEAGAMRAFQARRWKETVENASAWQRDEPFSSRPAALGGFVAAVALGDYSSAHTLLLGAVRANPKDFVLLNNQAFALASDNRPHDAARVLARIRTEDLTGEQRAVLAATHGLVRFRMGAFADGEAHYAEAIRAAERLNQRDLQALALVFLAREQALAGLPAAETTIASATKCWAELKGHGDKPMADAVLTAIPPVSSEG